MSRAKSMVPPEADGEPGVSAPKRFVDNAASTNAELKADRTDPGRAGTVGGKPAAGSLAAGDGAWRRMRVGRINTAASG
jgi:hypothetical protein